MFKTTGHRKARRRGPERADGAERDSAISICNSKIVKRSGLAVLPALLLLGACSSTITGSDRLADADMDRWAAVVNDLPVELHGRVPDYSGQQLAALFPKTVNAEYASLGPVQLDTAAQRIVLYINERNLPPNADLCRRIANPEPDMQPGGLARVTAALCDGPETISVATGLIRAHQSDEYLRSGVNMFRNELVEALNKNPQSFYN